MTKKLVVSLCLGLVLIASFSNFAHANEYKVGMAISGITHAWERNLVSGMKEEAQKQNIDLNVVDAKRNTHKMISDIENLITADCDLIIVSLGEKEPLAPALKKVREAGIPLITVDHESPHSLCNVSSNNYSIGLKIAQKMVDDLGGEGNIILFHGFPGVKLCQQRKAMLDAVLKFNPNIKVVEVLAEKSPGAMKDGMMKMDNMLTKYGEGEIDAVWAVWDQPLIGAAQAIMQAGRADDVKIYGINGAPTALKILSMPNSAYEATVAQKPGKIGKKAVGIAKKVLQGKQVPDKVYVESELVTRENVDEIIDKKSEEN